jgi:hypothetical protein
MRRTGAFLLTVGLAALMGSAVQAQPTSAPKVDPNVAIRPAPTRIIRNPPALRLAPKTLTPGMPIKVHLHPLRDGKTGGQFLAVTLPDGKQMGNPAGRGPNRPSDVSADIEIPGHHRDGA